MHKALKEVLGDHVQQKGSLVNPDYLRFDFTHFKQVTAEELRLAERIVNEQIRNCLLVQTEIKSLEEARAAGATALFGEKYSDKVRVVSIGDYSMELCGGTHLNYTGEIGLFKITSESSIAAGIRRIEAVTGEKADNFVYLLEDELDEFVEILNTPRKSAKEKIYKLLDENKKLQQELEKFQNQNAGAQINEILSKAKTINDIQVIAASVKIPDSKALRTMADKLKEKMNSGIGILIAEAGGKVSVVTVVSNDLKKKYPAGKIVNEVALIVGGRGGGRPDMAMAGGKDVSKIPDAIAAVPEIISKF